MAFNAGAVVSKVILDSSDWTTGYEQVQREKDLLKKGFDTLKIAAVGMSVAIGAAFVKMTSSAYEFEKGFSNVTTVIDTSVVDVKNLKSELLGLDDRLGSAANLTEGLYQALSANVDPAKAIGFVADAAKFAKAALVDTNTAVDVITTGLNAYGMAAENAGIVSDKFFKVVMLGKTTGQELSAVIGNSIPLAANFGISLDELGASIAVMTQQGIKSAQATTQFNSAVSAFIKPSEEMEKAIKAIGFSSGSAMVKQLGFKGALDAIVKSTNGNNEQLAAMFQNVEALRGVMALTGKGASNFASVLDAITNSAGSTNTAFEKQELTFETLSNSVNKAFIVLGESFLPIIKDIVKVVTDVASSIAGWDEGTKRLVLGVGAFVAAAIPMGMMISGIIKSFQILQPILLAIKAGFAFQAAAAGSSTIAITANTIATNIQTIALKAQALAQGALNAVMNLNPWAVAAVAVGLLTVAVVASIAAIKDSAKETAMHKKVNEEYIEANRETAKSILGVKNAHLEAIGAILPGQKIFNEETRSTVEGIKEEKDQMDQTLKRYQAELATLQGTVKTKNAIATIDTKNTKTAAQIATDKKREAEILDYINYLTTSKIELDKRATELAKIKAAQDKIAADKQAVIIAQNTEDFKASQLAQADAYRNNWSQQQTIAGSYYLWVSEEDSAFVEYANMNQEERVANEEAGTKKLLALHKAMGAAIEAGRKEQLEKEKLELQEKITLYKQTYDQIVGFVSQGVNSVFELTNQILENEKTTLENRLGAEKESFDESEKLKLEQLLTNYEANKETLEKQGYDEETLKAKLKELEDQYTLDKENAEKERTAFEKKQKAERDELKKKEFIANQIASAIQATIQTANAVVNVLATPGLPPWVSIPLAAVVGGLGAAQVIAILSQPVPEYAGGGFFDKGLAVVGEQGPELVRFEQPGRIFSNQESRKIMGGNNQTNNFNIRQDIDMDLAMRKLGNQQLKTSRGKI